MDTLETKVLAGQRRALREIRLVQEEKSVRQMAQKLPWNEQKLRRLEDGRQALTLAEAWYLADKYKVPSIDMLVGRR